MPEYVQQCNRCGRGLLQRFFFVIYTHYLPFDTPLIPKSPHISQLLLHANLLEDICVHKR